MKNGQRTVITSVSASGRMSLGFDYPTNPSIVIHAGDSWHDSVVRGKFDFFEKVACCADQRGYTSYAVRAATPASERLLGENHAHIIIGANVRTEREVLYAMPSYIWGFWYLDQRGVNWNSSLVGKAFCPEDIDQEKARYFFNGVSGYMLRENVSKFPQARLEDTVLPPAKAVVFLQELDKYKTPVHFLDTQKIVATVAKSTDQKVYVKLHPAQSELYEKRYRSICSRFKNVEISDRSIHALSRASEVVVTQNSAAGFEALMQKKPVITCARSDFHHATIVAKTPDELRQALKTAKSEFAGFPYKKYLYWFLGINMLEPTKKDFESRAWERISRVLPDR